MIETVEAVVDECPRIVVGCKCGRFDEIQEMRAGVNTEQSGVVLFVSVSGNVGFVAYSVRNVSVKSNVVGSTRIGRFDSSQVGDGVTVDRYVICRSFGPGLLDSE